VYAYKIADTYSIEMQQTLKDGLTRFGYGNWMSMYKLYPVFANYNVSIVRVRYVTLYSCLCVRVC
jgi:hypothetical protein